MQKVSIPELGEAMSQLLEEYNQEVVEGVDGAGMNAIQELVRLTRATAPVGFRGKFKRSIAWTEKYKGTSKLTGRTFVWYVKPPDHRLTHLLVKPHATKDGGQTKANPFLHNAVEKVQRQYIEDVEDALKW
jgi:hypothetical protein